MNIKIKLFYKLIIASVITSFSNLTHAEPINGSSIITSSYENLLENTLTFGEADDDIVRFPLNGSGVLDNHGRILIKAGEFNFNGRLNNKGLLDFSNTSSIINFSIQGNSIINNESTGLMNWRSSTLELLSSTTNNYGTINILPLFGDEYYAQASQLINIQYKGRINNFGNFKIDTPTHTNNSLPPNLVNQVFNNSGLFEISERGSLTTPHIFTQYSGETKVNGTLSVHKMDLKKGILSGKGTIIETNPDLYASEWMISNKVTLSPGSPFGTLTLSPSPDNSYQGVICTGCSMDIEIGSDSNYDTLHVNGSLYLGSLKLNVLLRDGYIPPVGKSFNIISADTTTLYGAQPILSNLPNGRTWTVTNNGTTIVLKAN